MKALVVDPSLVTRKVIVGGLSRSGIVEVDQVMDGFQAVHACKSTKYDLIVLETKLEKLSGVDTVRVIRKMGHSMPIIIVSDDAKKERILEALNAGAQSYLLKPFGYSSVVTKIKQVLNK